jgi:hypothetical protein
MTTSDRETEAFALTRAELQTRTVVRSLLRLRDRPLPCAVAPSSPTERSGTAIVIGAGPGLADQIEALREVADRATVFAVNASLGALRKAGITADWLVVRESLDQSHHLEGGGFTRAALDLACHEAIWAEAARHAAEVQCFVGAGVQFWQLADALDVRPLYGGTAALTAAVQLAAEFGAERIVLVGVDLAVIDSIAYSALSPYGAVKGRVEGDVVHFTETELWKEGARRVGAVPEPELQPAHMVECWDGQTRAGMHVAQIDWLETFAQRAERDGIACIDTSARGVRKAGWQSDTGFLRQRREPMPLDHVSPVHGPWVPTIERSRVAAFLDRLRADAAWCAAMEGDVAGTLTRGPMLGTGIVETTAAGDTVRAMRGATARERLAGVVAGVSRQGRWIVEALGETNG